MQDDWKTYKIGEIGVVITGNTPSSKNPDHYGSQIPFVTPSDFSNFHKNVQSTDRKLSLEGATALSKKILSSNSVLVTCIGSQMGKVAINREPVVTNQQLNSIVPNHKVEPDFLYYKMVAIHDILRKMAGGGSTMPILNKTDFENIEITLPPLSEQRAIAFILSALDDKIELNLQMNKTLEEMAMTLYKHWFVDFGPFQDGNFVESELGMIPEGWEVKRLGEISEVGSSKRIYLSEYVESGIPFLRGKEVIQLSKGQSISTELFISETRFNNIKEKFGVPSQGDILISSVGTIGVSWLVENDNPFYFKDGNLTWIKNYDSRVNGNFVSQWLKSPNCQEQIKSETIGSTQQALTISALKTLKMVLPPDDSRIVMEVSKDLELWNNQILSNKLENQTLTTLRDTLLPKLISGEVRVRDVEKQLSEVL